MMEQEFQDKIQKQVKPQEQWLHQYKCRIQSHENNSIRGICISEECKAQDRRVCQDCIIQGIHETDSQYSQQANEDQLIGVIKRVKLYFKKLIEYISQYLLLQHLDLANENDEKTACIKLKEIKKLNSQMRSINEILDNINIKEYAKHQQQTNLGIFQYLLVLYKEIQILNSNIYDHIQLGNILKDSYNVVKHFKTNRQDIEELKAFTKSKPKIISDIKKTISQKAQAIAEADNETKTQQLRELYQLGLVLQDQQQQYDLAILFHEVYLKHNSDDCNAYFKMGASLDQIGKSNDAIQMYDRALKINPSFYQALTFKGYSLNSLGHHKEALQCYDQAIELNPQYAYAYLRSFFQDLQRFDEAIQMYGRTIELSPYHPSAYNNKGLCLLFKKKYEEAIQIFDQVIENYPSYLFPLNNKGFCLHQLQRFEEAIQMYDRVIELNPKFQYGFYNKGNSLMSLKRFQEATLIFNKAIELSK